MNLDIVVIGPVFSPLAYVDRETGQATGPTPAVDFCTHRFFETADHQLGHEQDGRLRAIVPPEGWEDYAYFWPDCQPLVDALSTPPAREGSGDDDDDAHKKHHRRAR